MRLQIEKAPFIKSWSLAERSVGTTSAMNILSGIRLRATTQGVTLSATDLKTSISLEARGVTVGEEGDAVFPVKVVGDLFKKVPGETFSLELNQGKASISAARNRYRFSTYPVEEFPKLPTSKGASFFCATTVGALSDLLDEGTLAASQQEEFPQYLSCAFFKVDPRSLSVVTTDSRRLSLSRTEITEGADFGQLLLPMKGVKELQRVLGALDDSLDLKILADDAQAYFKTEDVEFAVRKTDAHFPAYEKILPTTRTTWMKVDKSLFLEALERIEIVVRDYNRMVLLQLSPGGNLVLTGKAPDVGEAVEVLDAEIDGESLRIALNVRFAIDGVKALRSSEAQLDFNGPEGHLLLKRSDSDDFLCLIAPIALTEEELTAEADEV